MAVKLTVYAGSSLLPRDTERLGESADAEVALLMDPVTSEALAGAFRRALPTDASDPPARQLEPDTVPGWDRKRLDGIEAVEAELRALARFPSPA